MSTSDFFENLAEKRNKINVKSAIQAGVEVGDNIADTAKGIVDRFNRARTSAVDASASSASIGFAFTPTMKTLPVDGNVKTNRGSFCRKRFRFKRKF
jgi:hypothetical protein